MRISYFSPLHCRLRWQPTRPMADRDLGIGRSWGVLIAMEHMLVMLLMKETRAYLG